MAFYVLDTGILFGMLKGDAYGKAAVEARGLDDPSAEVTASIATQAELRAFALRRQWQEKRLEALEALFRRIPFVPIEKPSLINAFAEP